MLGLVHPEGVGHAPFYVTECFTFADSAITFPVHFLWNNLNLPFLRVGSSWVALDTAQDR